MLWLLVSVISFNKRLSIVKWNLISRHWQGMLLSVVIQDQSFMDDTVHPWGGFRDQALKWCKSFPSKSHWLKVSHMATSKCKIVSLFDIMFREWTCFHMLFLEYSESVLCSHRFFFPSSVHFKNYMYIIMPSVTVSLLVLNNKCT